MTFWTVVGAVIMARVIIDLGALVLAAIVAIILGR